MEIHKKIAKNRKSDVIGIGSPLLDIIINVDDKLLLDLKVKKGSMKLISSKESKNILNKLKDLKWEMALGGSASNTLSGLNLLGNQVSFSGILGKDEHGKIYHEKIKEEGIGSHLTFNDKGLTGHSIILITPDGERTMLAHLGAALSFSKRHVKKEEIENSKILHIEAYQLEDPKIRVAILEAMKIAKNSGVVISLDLSDVGLIQRNKKLFEDIIREHINIVFANEEEAFEFSGIKNSKDALHKIAENCDIAVVKLGEKGSLIKENKGSLNINPHAVDVINTNGAGDMYAAGILHGVVNGLDLKSAGEIASHVASLVVASSGARLDKKYFKLINKYKKNGKGL